MDNPLDIITKTLYIQIDETPMPEMPELLTKMVPTVDCRLMNDFYSCFGAALCGDLTAPDGRKLYRLIKPAGRILAEYAASDGSAEAMADLRKQWYDLLVTILDGSCAPTFIFTLPTHFLKWLERHPTNDLYPLLTSRNQITLHNADIATDIRSHAEKIIAKALEKDTTCVFSNPKFDIKKPCKQFNIALSSYNDWGVDINKPMASVDVCIYWILDPHHNIPHLGHITHSDTSFENIFTLITYGVQNSRKWSYNDLLPVFLLSGFDITDPP